MNTRSAAILPAVFVILLVTTVSALAVPAATAFTYQGKLTDSAGTPLSGSYALAFKLFDAATGGSQVGSTISISDVAVSAGLFTVSLDFGISAFTGQKLWLETSVEKDVLSPRTELSSAPTAICALTVTDGAITSTKLASGSVTADKISAGQVVKSINGLKDNITLTAGAGISITPSGSTLTLSTTAAAGWSLTGNAGTIPGTNFIGTTDDKPFEIRVNNMSALRLEPGPLPNVILGSPANTVTTGAYSATIGGGGSLAFGNRVTDSFGTIGGGLQNRAGDDAGTTSDRSYATVGGGYSNIAEGSHSTVSGGKDNRARGNGSAVGGGDSNAADGSWASVPGGQSNSAYGDYSLAAGRRAKANHTGSFVWADSTDADFASSADNQFLIRASGNVGINNTDPRATLSIGPNITGVYPAVNSIQIGSTDNAVLLMGKDSNNSLSLGWNDLGGYAQLYTHGYKPLILQRYSGNLGVGTEDPQKKLSVSAGMNIDQSNANNGTLDTGLTFGSNSGEGIASKRTSGGNQNGLDFYTNSTSRLSITQVGNVGVGTAAPLTRLQVEGAEYSDTDNLFGPLAIKELTNNVDTPAGTTVLALKRVGKFGAAYDSSAAFQLKRYSSSGFSANTQMDILLGNGSTPKPDMTVMSLLANGNVGIGSTTPEEKLTVRGSLKVDQGDVNNGTFASGGVIKFGSGATGEGIGSKRTAGGNWAGIDFYTGSTIRMTVANGGNVGIGTTSPAYKLDVNGTIRGSNVSPSDICLKTNIRDLSNSLDSVMKLRGVSFDWKDESLASGRQIGVIAQELETVFPELVSRDAEGIAAVAYDKLVPVLIEAIKEQQAQMDAKDARINDLEARMERLEKLLADAE